jgi:dolichol-phosphate mannosyltransferase
MMACQEERQSAVGRERVSLVLRLLPGRSLSAAGMAEFRELLQANGSFDSIEVIVSRPAGQSVTLERAEERGNGEEDDGVIYVSSERAEWSPMVRAGLRAATGDHVVVLDLGRNYSPRALAQVLEPVRLGHCDIAVAVPERDGGLLGLGNTGAGLGMITRYILGTSDVFSGLFAMKRSVWERAGNNGALAKSPVLDSLLRRPARSIDVKVDVDDQFRERQARFSDLRPLKHALDSRFGNYSRLAQFCLVGASGMFVDLTFYALLQWLLSFTALAALKSPMVFGGTWHLAIAAALAIATALVWNFTLNRRLTFNDARSGSVSRQFLTYVLSNALAIAMSFSLRLYLPSRVAFFARHRLAAAVVGIVTATGISFTMARWLVFARRTDVSGAGR